MVRMLTARYVIVLASSTRLARVHVSQTRSLLSRQAEASWVLTTSVFRQHLLDTLRIFQVFIGVFQVLHKGLFVVYFVGDRVNYWSLGGVTRGHEWSNLMSNFVPSRGKKISLYFAFVWTIYFDPGKKIGCHPPQISCWERYKRCCRTSGLEHGQEREAKTHLAEFIINRSEEGDSCLLYTSPSPRDA